jgi:hypothetical protein
MPEAPIDKDGDASFLNDEVRVANDVGRMHPPSSNLMLLQQ